MPRTPLLRRAPLAASARRPASASVRTRRAWMWMQVQVGEQQGLEGLLFCCSCRGSLV